MKVDDDDWDEEGFDLHDFISENGTALLLGVGR